MFQLLQVLYLCLPPFSGPWKKKSLADFGIVTQCIAPGRVNDQYLTNVLLKINAKVRYVICDFTFCRFEFYRIYTLTFDCSEQLGGLNSILSVERTPAMPLVSRVPTMILGMDVSHGSPGRSDVPSIAAVI